MTKQQLEYFLTAVEFCNLSKAASFHYVSIPTFTRHINDLEAELSTKLFNRNNRGLTLTTAGALFHSFARDTLLQMYRYYITIRDKGLLAGEPRDEFILGYFAFGGMFPAYAKLIDRYLNLWLKKPCVLHCVQGGQMLEMVRSGLIDVGAVSESQVKKHADEFEYRTFFKTKCQLLVDENHPLAGRESITVEEIARDYGAFERYFPKGILPQEFQGQSIRGTGDILRICRKALDFFPLLASQKSESDDFLLNCDMIFLTTGIQRPELKNKRALTIKGGDTSMNVCLFWRRDNNSPAIGRFKDALEFAEIR